MSDVKNKTKIFAVVGPTASGKSGLALALCRELGGELISCDSMQVYRRMDIGTAKPTTAEQAAVPHHLIDVAEPWEPFSCADYVALAAAAIEDCVARGRLPIVCGGTGLYLDALLRKNDFAENTSDEAVRAELMAFAAAHGAEALHRELQAVDPDSAAAIHPNNVKRVARALEIYRVSGLTKTEQDRRSRQGGERYHATVLGLRYADRAVLYRRMDRRVDQMVEQGLIEETRALLAEGVFAQNQTAAQAIGYKELLPYLQGSCTQEEAIERLKLATRQYGKRQMTWFSARPYVQWLELLTEGEPMREKTFEEIVNHAKQLFQNEALCDKIKA